MQSLITASASIYSQEEFYYLQIIPRKKKHRTAYLIRREKVEWLRKYIKEGKETKVSIGIARSIPDRLYYLDLVTKDQSHFYILLSWEEKHGLSTNNDLRSVSTHDSYIRLL